MQALFGAFGIKGSLLLAQAVNFAIVLVALWYVLYKPINKILADRQRVVTKGVQDAEKAAATLASADTEAAARVRTADTAAEEIVKAARADASTERARLITDAEVRAAQIAKDAEARAVEDTLRMRQESEKEVARLAILAAEKVLRTS